jgi:predicted phosphodiesterase
MTRIAVISDIHGNIGALEAVLRDIELSRVDQTVNLGDICSGVLHPAQTADRLIPLNLPTITGNHERQLQSHAYEKMGISDRFAADNLEASHFAWLSQLPRKRRLNDDVLMVHGTPRSDVEELLETMTDHGSRLASHDEVAQRTSGVSANVILCGHSHVARTFRCRNGALIVNPGSVGVPPYIEDKPINWLHAKGPHKARYAIVEQADGRWSAELRSIVYDWEAAAQTALANGKMEWAEAFRFGFL